MLSDEQESQALVPIQEKRVNFYGDEIIAVLVEVGGERQVYVPVRQLCHHLGIDWASQYQRMKRDDVLAEDMTSVVVITTLVPEQRYKQRYAVICLPLEDVPGWLFGISPSRVKPEFQEKIRRYRRKCYQVLWQAFAADVEPVTQVVPSSSAMMPSEVEHLLGVTNLVHEHLEILAGTLTPLSDKLDYAVHLLETLVGRQETAEKKIAKIDERTQRLTPEHTRDVAEFVEQMVHETATSTVPLDHYKIYGRLKHHFRTNSYKEVADERFGEVMDFLREMLRKATNTRQGNLF